MALVRTPQILGALAIAFLAGALALADVSKCACDAAKPESLAAHECSLCAEAEKQDSKLPIFFLKDISPRKPNRWLALPRNHHAGPHTLREMTAAERKALWKAAIEKSNEMWGDKWGVAYNGDEVRTQCHAHIHIGQTLPESENDQFVVVSTIEEIPVPVNHGMWIHGAPDGKLHVHTGEQINEKYLMR